MNSPLLSAIQAWGPLAGMVGVIITLITVWIRGIPARLLAKSAGDATLRGEEKGLREYLSAELEKCKKDNDELADKIKALEAQHKQDMKDRDGKIFQLEVLGAMFLRHLLIVDPDNRLVRDAKAVLELNIGFPTHPLAIEQAIEQLKAVAPDVTKSDPLKAAELAVIAAEGTVVRAEKTVIEVKGAEKPDDDAGSVK